MSARHFLTAALLLALLALAPAAKASSFLVDDGDAGFSTTGTWTPYTSGFFIHNDMRYTPVDAVATATYTPAGVSFTPGNYNLYAQWDPVSSVGTTDALYTITHTGGTATVHINQMQQAHQAVVTGAPFNDLEGSGFCYLGNYTLNNSSNVTLSNNAGTGILTTDAIYGTNDGLLIDEFSANVTYTSYSAGQMYSYGNAGLDVTSDFGYGNTGATATYTPGVSGLREVKISWAALDTFSSNNVTYLVDLDGNLLTTGDQTLFTLNERKTAANQPSGPDATVMTWSDFYSLGNYQLTPASTITATNHDPSNGLTVDAMFVSNQLPEPASGVLLLVGVAGCVRRRRRR